VHGACIDIANGVTDSEFHHVIKARTDHHSRRRHADHNFNMRTHSKP
jgi:hypothetical protein